MATVGTRGQEPGRDADGEASGGQSPLLGAPAASLREHMGMCVSVCGDICPTRRSLPRQGFLLLPTGGLSSGTLKAGRV